MLHISVYISATAAAAACVLHLVHASECREIIDLLEYHRESGSERCRERERVRERKRVRREKVIMRERGSE